MLSSKIKEKSPALLLGFFYFWNMVKDDKQKIIISIEKRPFWQLLIAALLYTSAIYVLSLVFHYWSMRWIAVGMKYLQLALLMLCGGLKFSSTRTIYLDITSKKLKIEYSVGLIKLDFFKISDLNYISVFKNTSTEEFEINLWYKTNKHINIAILKEFNAAFDCGLNLSNKLNIDFLDATEKGNSKWIDKTKL